MKDFSFYHLTDLHYYANDVIGSYGKYYEEKCKLEQKCMAQTGAIIDAAFQTILEDKETDIVLISGDLTFDGEVQSHDSLREKLRALQQQGKRVFITFATHDFYMHAQRYTDTGTEDLPKYTRAQLREHYREFGYDQAIAEHEGSYSYCVQLTEDTRLLCLNDDGDFDDFCGYYNDQLFWIKDQIEAAKKDGCRIFAMTHHPLLEPSPIYPVISHRGMLGGYEFAAPYLADLGLEYIFVGHTHIHDINSLTTKKGNTIYQVNTGALTGHPLAYRKVTYTDDGMDVKSQYVEKIDWDLGGRDLREYARDHFISMIRSLFNALENDFDEFVYLFSLFIGESKNIDKLEPILKPLGKFVTGLTFRSIAKVFGGKEYLTPEVADKRIVDFLCEVVIDMYGGNADCTPDKPEYKIFMNLCKKVLKLIKVKDSKGEPIDMVAVFAGTLYNAGIDDHNAFLKSAKKGPLITK